MIFVNRLSINQIIINPFSDNFSENTDNFVKNFFQLQLETIKVDLTEVPV